MSTPKIQQAAAFAGLEPRLTSVSEPAELVRDAVGAFVDAITTPGASQTSYSDHP